MTTQLGFGGLSTGGRGASSGTQLVDGQKRNNPATGQPQVWNQATNSWIPDPTVSIGGATEIGTLRVTSTGNYERWTGSTWVPITFDVLSSPIVEQVGLPTRKPTDPNQSALIYDTASDTTWSWDIADQVWRSVGLIAESAVLAQLNANVWANFPMFQTLSTISRWDILDSNGVVLTLIETQRRADGWPQIRSLHQHDNLRIEATGYGTVTPS